MQLICAALLVIVTDEDVGLETGRPFVGKLSKWRKISKAICSRVDVKIYNKHGVGISRFQYISKGNKGRWPHSMCIETCCAVCGLNLGSFHGFLLKSLWRGFA